MGSEKKVPCMGLFVISVFQERQPSWSPFPRTYHCVPGCHWGPLRDKAQTGAAQEGSIVQGISLACTDWVCPLASHVEGTAVCSKKIKWLDGYVGGGNPEKGCELQFQIKRSSGVCGMHTGGRD